MSAQVIPYNFRHRQISNVQRAAAVTEGFGSMVSLIGSLEDQLTEMGDAGVLLAIELQADLGRLFREAQASIRAQGGRA